MAGFLPHNTGIPLNKMRILDSYGFVYILKGAGRYADGNGVNLPVTAGDSLWLWPDLAHAYGPPAGQTWSEIYFVYDGPVFDLWRERGLFDLRQPVQQLAPIDYWLQRFESVLGAPRQTGFAPALVEVCRLQTVLAEALHGGMKGNPDMAWASQACALLEADLTRELDLATLAHQLQTSSDSLRKRFTRVVGLSPARFRSRRIIDRACALMQQGTLTDKQIATRLGFCDEFHFSKRFKSITGVTPRAFRRSLPLGSGSARPPASAQ